MTRTVPDVVLKPRVLETDPVRAVVYHQVGGKIASLVDRATGREWLWQNPRLPIAPPVYDSSYVEAHDSGGFDECFPAVGAGPYPVAPWEGTPIPDHGELVGLPWEAEPGSRRSRMGVDGVRFPYHFERAIALGETAEVRLSYRVQNRSPFPFPFIWSAHPLFAIAPGMRILLPDGHALKVYGVSNPDLGTLGTSLVWPYLGPHRLDRVPEPTMGLAVKLFGESPAQGWIGLHDPETSTTLRLEFNPLQVPHLGLWLNFGGWSPHPGGEPYFNVGLEPCIGAGDDLSLAVKHFKAHGTLRPMSEQTWTLTLRWVRETLS